MPDVPRASELPPGGIVDDTLVDVGDYLEVPEAERLEHDDVVAEEINLDEFADDFADVPDGDVVTLSSAQGPIEGQQ